MKIKVFRDFRKNLLILQGTFAGRNKSSVTLLLSRDICLARLVVFSKLSVKKKNFFKLYYLKSRFTNFFSFTIYISLPLVDLNTFILFFESKGSFDRTIPSYLAYE